VLDEFQTLSAARPSWLSWRALEELLSIGFLRRKDRAVRQRIILGAKSPSLVTSLAILALFGGAHLATRLFHSSVIGRARQYR